MRGGAGLRRAVPRGCVPGIPVRSGLFPQPPAGAQRRPAAARGTLSTGGGSGGRPEPAPGALRPQPRSRTPTPAPSHRCTDTLGRQHRRRRSDTDAPSAQTQGPDHASCGGWTRTHADQHTQTDSVLQTPAPRLIRANAGPHRREQTPTHPRDIASPQSRWHTRRRTQDRHHGHRHRHARADSS